MLKAFAVNEQQRETVLRGQRAEKTNNGRIAIFTLLSTKQLTEAGVVDLRLRDRVGVMPQISQPLTIDLTEGPR